MPYNTGKKTDAPAVTIERVLAALKKAYRKRDAVLTAQEFAKKNSLSVNSTMPKDIILSSVSYGFLYQAEQGTYALTNMGKEALKGSKKILAETLFHSEDMKKLSILYEYYPDRTEAYDYFISEGVSERRSDLCVKVYEKNLSFLGLKPHIILTSKEESQSDDVEHMQDPLSALSEKDKELEIPEIFDEDSSEISEPTECNRIFLKGRLFEKVKEPLYELFDVFCCVPEFDINNINSCVAGCIVTKHVTPNKELLLYNMKNLFGEERAHMILHEGENRHVLDDVTDLLIWLADCKLLKK